jgi:hypothetical protein
MTAAAKNGARITLLSRSAGETTCTSAICPAVGAVELQLIPTDIGVCPCNNRAVMLVRLGGTAAPDSVESAMPLITLDGSFCAGGAAAALLTAS